MPLAPCFLLGGLSTQWRAPAPLPLQPRPPSAQCVVGREASRPGEAGQGTWDARADPGWATFSHCDARVFGLSRFMEGGGGGPSPGLTRSHPASGSARATLGQGLATLGGRRRAPGHGWPCLPQDPELSGTDPEPGLAFLGSCSLPLDRGGRGWRAGGAVRGAPAAKLLNVVGDHPA